MMFKCVQEHEIIFSCLLTPFIGLEAFIFRDVSRDLSHAQNFSII